MQKDIQTLHSHTTTSDGALGYLEVLNLAQELGISTVAFTDHDSLPTEQSVKTLLKNKGHATRWIMGIEISSGLPEEIGGGPFSGLHIVGLFVDPHNRELQKHCQLAQQARVSRMKKMVKNLESLGFDITADDCLRASGGEAVGRPHIVQALKSKEHNLAVIEGLRKKMEIEAQTNPDIKEKFDLMMQQGERQYPYTLFLTEGAYIPGIYMHYEYWANMDKSVELIRNAGGLSFLAHYWSAKRKISPALLENFIKEKQLDGVETVFGLWAYRTDKKIIVEEARQLCRQLAAKYNCLISGGADAHTKKDFIDFANADWYNRETSRMAETIIQKSGVDTTWSSFNT